MENDRTLFVSNLEFTDDYVSDIKLILAKSRHVAYRNVNTIMVQAYWMIGYRIVVQEQKGKERADYGSRLIENLSKELSTTFGDGISVAQLWNFRLFYNTFPDVEILNTLCRELSWSHIRLIMRLNTADERNYYIEESKHGNWSVRELQRNIKTDAYHRLVVSQTNNTSISQSISKHLCLTKLLLKPKAEKKYQNLEIHRGLPSDLLFLLS